MNHLTRLFVPALAFIASAGSLFAEGQVVCSWNDLPVGEAPPQNVGSAAVGTKGAELRVVNSSSDPASPFEGKSALHIKNSAGARTSVSCLLSQPPALKGWLEVDLCMGTENLIIDLIQRPPGAPAEINAFRADGTSTVAIFVRANNSTLVTTRDLTEKVTFFPKIQEDVPTTLHIAWDLTATPPSLTFKVNGEEATDSTGSPITVPFTKADPSVGIDVVRIVPGTSFLGEIRASD